MRITKVDSKSYQLPGHNSRSVGTHRFDQPVSSMDLVIGLRIKFPIINIHGLHTIKLASPEEKERKNARKQSNKKRPEKTKRHGKGTEEETKNFAFTRETSR